MNPRSEKMPEKHLHTMCGAMISGSGLMSYRCDRPLGHTEIPPEDPEPHYAPEVQRTVQAWQEWKWRQDNMEPTHVATAKGGEHPKPLDFGQCPAHPNVEVAVEGGQCGECGWYPGRPDVLTANWEEIRAGEIHNPFDGGCQKNSGVLLDREWCYRCRASEVEHPALVDTAFNPEAHLDEFETSMVEALRTREGDQRLPDGDESIPDDQTLLIADIEARRQVGIQRYTQGHRPFNGRDTLKDWYEEQLDGLVYARSIMRSADATREDLIGEVLRAWEANESGSREERSVTPEDHATIAVDRIMGWVAANIVDTTPPYAKVTVDRAEVRKAINEACNQPTRSRDAFVEHLLATLLGPEAEG